VLRRVQSQNLVDAADSGIAGTAGSALKTALESLRDLDVVGDVRGLGLPWGLNSSGTRRPSSHSHPREISAVRSDRVAYDAASWSTLCKAARTEWRATISSLPHLR
jgi:4-aminobutyrate aminotransferase-like enzyme